MADAWSPAYGRYGDELKANEDALAEVQAKILQGLGWKLLRVWSTEWWVDKEGALGRLHLAIVELLEKSRLEAPKALTAIDEASSASIGQTELAPVVPALVAARVDPPTNEADRRMPYVIADLGDVAASVDPERFYLPDYDATLRLIIQRVLEHEAPILDALLVQRVARLHGFQRAGRLIRERVLDLTDRHHHVAPDSLEGSFVWMDAATVDGWSFYREPGAGGESRSIEEVPMQEFRAAAQAVSGADRTVKVARIFGVV